MLQPPDFWQTDLATIEKTAKRATCGRAVSVARSAGGRDIWAFAYGTKQVIPSPANYNSACGGQDLRAFANVECKKPVLLLVGAEHGSETEGTAAIMNAISLLETGVDLAGNPNEAFLDAAEGVRLVMVPVANPDGRARVTPQSCVGMDFHTHRYWAQGTWPDGSLLGWPECKKVHPMTGHGFLGGYYNDEGINPMHDDFFAPMGPEAKAVLDLARSEFADCVLHLHGGSNSINDLIQPTYVPLEINEAVRRLAVACDERAKAESLSFYVRDIPAKERGKIPPSFNLCSATHHVCGAISAIFESNQHIIDEPGEKLTHQQIYKSHMILFETCMLMMKKGSLR